MRICFLSNAGSNHTQIIANHFVRAGHEVHLISPDFKNGYDARIRKYQLKHLPLGKTQNYVNSFTWPWQTRKLVKSIRPDILSGQYVTVYGLLAAFSGFHPLIVTAWGSDLLLQARSGPLWRMSVNYTLKRADLLTCLFDERMLDRQNTLIPPGLKVVSLPYGTDVDFFKKDKQTKDLRARARVSLGIGEDIPLVINTRSLSPVYDPATLLRAIPEVKKAFPSVLFLIVHKKENPNPYLDLIKSLHIERNILFLDWMSPEKLVEYLNIADVYVSASLSDGASNALFEAMACEIAPVVTDIPANRYWVEDGENGFLFKPGDHAALSSEIIILLGDLNKRAAFGQKCRAIIAERANRRIQMAKMEELYAGMVSASSREKNPSGSSARP